MGKGAGLRVLALGSKLASKGEQIVVRFRFSRHLWLLAFQKPLFPAPSPPPPGPGPFPLEWGMGGPRPEKGDLELEIEPFPVPVDPHPFLGAKRIHP